MHAILVASRPKGKGGCGFFLAMEIIAQGHSLLSRDCNLEKRAKGVTKLSL